MANTSDLQFFPPGDALDWWPRQNVSTLTMAEQLAKSLGAAIIAGDIAGGQRLLESELSVRFKVSRAPVREALYILEREGLIEVHPRRGARVTEVSADELDHIFEPRILLHGLLARRVAQHSDEAFAASFEAAALKLDALAGSENGRPYIEAVYWLTRLLFNGCDNEYLSRLASLLLHWTLRYTWLGLSTPARRKQSAQNWMRLAQAIAGHDGEAAQRIAEQQVRESRDAAMEILSRRDAAAHADPGQRAG